MKSHTRIFTVLLLVVAMCFSMAITVSAADVDENVNSSISTFAVEEKEILNIPLQMVDGPVRFTVFPAAGAKLWVVAGCNDGGTCTVTVKRQGALFNSDSFTLHPDGSVVARMVEDNCTGDPYVITFRGIASTIAGKVLQTN